MSRFFIDRPVFARVLGLALMLAGGIEILLLPVAQFPSIAPPKISITTTYPGASPQTVSDTVVRPILQQMPGLDGLEYISSSAESDGTMEIDLTFVQGTDPDIAQVQVLNKLSLAEATLPAAVTQQGLAVNKSAKSFMLIIGLISTDGSMSSADIGDYIASYIQDPVTRIPGVGDYTLFGAEYAMRVWLDPDKLYKYSLTVGDVTNAIAAQNVQVSSGQLGGLPAHKGQRLVATIIGPSLFQTPEEFENILLKVNQDGSQVRLHDVGRVELGPQSYNISALYNGKPASALALKLSPGANQLTAEAAVKAELHRLSQFFPPGLEIVYPLDTKPFITLSIREVVKTLFEAVALVFAVTFVFLQNFRATLIPTIAVPIVLLGTFAVLAAFGYSINTLTMLAMVLAVGLLVDDAIVVVENVERLIEERRLSPREAARQSMGEISGALVGIALVLSAVFLPMAFFSGSTGVIDRQFSVTIVSAMVLSVLVAQIVTPALCATLLKPAGHAEAEPANRFSALFNRGFDWINRRYGAAVGRMIAHSRWSLLGFAVITVAAVLLFARIPTGFLPDEDQALLFGQIITPPGATAEETARVNREVTDYLLTSEKDGVASVLSVTGYNFAGNSQNAGFLAIKLKDWSERPNPGQSAAEIARRGNQHFFENRDARIIVFQPPAVMELGNATGFDLELEDRGQLGHEKLVAARNELLSMAAQDPGLAGVRPNGLEDAPQYRLDIDREKANAMGVSVSNLDAIIQGALGSQYVNLFLRAARVKQVYVQGVPSSRMLPSDLSLWYVRNSTGGMVPFDAFLSGSWTLGPQKVENYNGLTSLEILGAPGPGSSSGTAMATMQRLVSQLPAGIGYNGRASPTNSRNPARRPARSMPSR